MPCKHYPYHYGISTRLSNILLIRRIYSFNSVRGTLRYCYYPLATVNVTRRTTLSSFWFLVVRCMWSCPGDVAEGEDLIPLIDPLGDTWNTSLTGCVYECVQSHSSVTCTLLLRHCWLRLSSRHRRSIRCFLLEIVTPR